MSIQIIVILCISLLAIIVIGTRIADGRYGRLQASETVLESYTSFRVDPDKNYYTSGSDAYPNALMGIYKDWSLESDLWKKRNLIDSGMQELVLNMQQKAAEKMLFLHGFDVLDNRGGKIGDWYSVSGLHIIIKVSGEKRVSITTPPLDTYRESA
ncbi:MAG: hypothetical protein M0P57_03050 [Syntrophales bacterium]|jgi:hypothetical protein|nr:hypothetical protein [Syntrophales bacterium]MDY0044331.1 hypothetical protein [Syntrophales bacterium]